MSEFCSSTRLLFLSSRLLVLSSPRLLVLRLLIHASHVTMSGTHLSSPRPLVLRLFIHATHVTMSGATLYYDYYEQIDEMITRGVFATLFSFNVGLMTWFHSLLIHPRL